MIQSNTETREELAALLRETGDALERGQFYGQHSVSVETPRAEPASVRLEIEVEADKETIDAAMGVLRNG